MGGYFILYAMFAIWVYFNAAKRKYSPGLWAVGTLILGPIVLPVYFAKRPLVMGETREGGVAWNVLKNFVLFWTLTMLFAGIAGCAGASHVAQNASTDVEKVGAGLGMTLMAGIMFGAWIVPAVSAAVLGFFLKQSNVVEKGPTGPLAQ